MQNKNSTSRLFFNTDRTLTISSAHELDENMINQIKHNITNQIQNNINDYVKRVSDQEQVFEQYKQPKKKKKKQYLKKKY